MALIEIDARSLMIYWEAGEEALQAALRAPGGAEGRLTLRIRDTSLADPDAGARELDLEVDSREGTRILKLEEAFRLLRCDLGLKANGGGFLALARSNLAQTPREEEPERFDGRFRRLAPALTSWAQRAPPLRPRFSSLEPTPDSGRPPAEGLGPPPPRPDRPPSMPWESPPDVESGKPPVSGGEERQSPAGRPAEGVGRPEAPPELLREVSSPRGAFGRREATSSPMGHPAAPGGAWSGAFTGSFGGAITGALAVPLSGQGVFDLRAEVVIHGRALPGTVIHIAGARVQVRADGTFEARFALPSGPEDLTGGQGQAEAPGAPDGT